MSRSGGVEEREKLTGSHVARDMLGTGEGCVADGAFVIASHWEEERKWYCRTRSHSLVLVLKVGVEQRAVWLC